MKTAEDEARLLLRRLGVPGAMNYSAGELVELANLIASRQESPAYEILVVALPGTRVRVQWITATGAIEAESVHERPILGIVDALIERRRRTTTSSPHQP